MSDAGDAPTVVYDPTGHTLENELGVVSTYSDESHVYTW